MSVGQELNTKEPVVQLINNVAVVHCCCILNPSAFKDQFGPTRLTTEQLYIALWEVTHNFKIRDAALAREMGVAPQTAALTREKTLEILTQAHRPQ